MFCCLISKHANKSSLRTFSTQSIYEFSKLYTHNQLGLPRLPIPNLNDTIKKYLASVQALTTAEDFAKHEKLVSDFQRTAAVPLHDKLVRLDAENAKGGRYPYHYFEDVWDDMYLATRDPIPIGSNPALLLDLAPNEIPQARIAARFLHAFALWTRSLLAGELPPDPPTADFSQQFFTVGTGRVPLKSRDGTNANHAARHAVVIHRDRYFKVDLITPAGKHVGPAELERALDSIRTLAAEPCLVGRLTTAHRDVWAEARAALEGSSPVNVANLHAIDTALLVVVLEDATPASADAGLGLWLKGAASRWYDKHQLIVTPNGLAGLTFEHALGDGLTWLQWVAPVWEFVRGQPLQLPSAPKAHTKEAPAVEAMQWDVPAEVAAAASEAQDTFQRAADNCTVQTVSTDLLPRVELKRRKMPPDGTAQLALQLAHHRLHGFMAPTYESCSTRTFFHGRTETIRSATMEARAFAEAMVNPATTPAARWGLFQAAAAKHAQISREAAQGQGVDRHLMMLKVLGRQDPHPHPFLSDPLFLNSSTWRLSTSNITTPIVSHFCFGPVVPHGYGVGYSILPDVMRFNVTSYEDNRTTDGGALCDAVERSLQDIAALSAHASP